MMKKTALAVAVLLLHGSAIAADYKKVIAHGKQVQVLTTRGKIITVREKYAVQDALLAPDGMTAAWLLEDLTLDDTPGEKGASTLVIYSKGKRRTLACAQLIRQFWFHAHGQQIAFDCGGRHFAGTEVLFDTRTLKELARLYQADVAHDQRPAWSASADVTPEQ